MRPHVAGPTGPAQGAESCHKRDLLDGSTLFQRLSQQGESAPATGESRIDRLSQLEFF